MHTLPRSGLKEKSVVKRFRNSYFLLLLALLFFGLAASTYLVLSGRIGISRNTQISDLVVCDRSIEYAGNENAICTGIFPKSVNELFVCGYLETENIDNVGLTILLLRSSSEMPIYVSPANLRFNRGHFCHEIDLPVGNKTGHYTIKVYFYRKIIASSVFEIR
jgi:hypothetical protein